jgi:hypothetical protein
MNPRIVLLSGGVLMMVGAFFPWGKIDTLLHDVSLLGIRGVGILTLAIGAVIAVLALLGKAQSEQRASITGAVLGVIGGAIALFAFTKPLIATPQALPDALLAAGIGLYITTAGAVLAVIGGVQKLEPGAELDWISGILHWLGTTLKLMTYNKVGFIGFLATSWILIILPGRAVLRSAGHQDQARPDLPAAFKRALAGHRSSGARHILADRPRRQGCDLCCRHRRVHLHRHRRELWHAGGLCRRQASTARSWASPTLF